MARGWLLRPPGKAIEVPEHLLENDELTYPWTLQEMKPGQAVKYIDPSDTYRRHELVEGEAYLFLRDSSRMGDVSEAQIRELLGPLAAKRAKMFEVLPRDLAMISQGLGDRSLERHGGCVLIIPKSMWQDADPGMRTLFSNIAKIERINYRVEDIGLGGAYWLYEGA
jgi:hypothetical protein